MVPDHKITRWSTVTTIELTEEDFLCRLLLGLGVDVSKFRKIDQTGKQLDAFYATLNRLVEDWKANRISSAQKDGEYFKVVAMVGQGG